MQNIVLIRFVYVQSINAILNEKISRFYSPDITKK